MHSQTNVPCRLVDLLERHFGVPSDVSTGSDKSAHVEITTSTGNPSSSSASTYQRTPPAAATTPPPIPPLALLYNGATNGLFFSNNGLAVTDSADGAGALPPSFFANYRSHRLLRETSSSSSGSNSRFTSEGQPRGASSETSDSSRKKKATSQPTFDHTVPREGYYHMEVSNTPSASLRVGLTELEGLIDFSHASAASMMASQQQAPHQQASETSAEVRTAGGVASAADSETAISANGGPTSPLRHRTREAVTRIHGALKSIATTLTSVRKGGTHRSPGGDFVVEESRQQGHGTETSPGGSVQQAQQMSSSSSNDVPDGAVIHRILNRALRFMLLRSDYNGTVWLIKSIVHWNFCEVNLRVAFLFNFLQDCLPTEDVALVNLIMSTWCSLHELDAANAMFTDIATELLKRALEWLFLDAHPDRRVSALLIVQHVAGHGARFASILAVHLSELLLCIWNPLKDSSARIRELAASTLECLLEIALDRSCTGDIEQLVRKSSRLLCGVQQHLVTPMSPASNGHLSDRSWAGPASLRDHSDDLHDGSQSDSGSLVLVGGVGSEASVDTDTAVHAGSLAIGALICAVQLQKSRVQAAAAVSSNNNVISMSPVACHTQSGAVDEGDGSLSTSNVPPAAAVEGETAFTDAEMQQFNQSPLRSHQGDYDGEEEEDCGGSFAIHSFDAPILGVDIALPPPLRDYSTPLGIADNSDRITFVAAQKRTDLSSHTQSPFSNNQLFNDKNNGNNAASGALQVFLPADFDMICQTCLNPRRQSVKLYTERLLPLLALHDHVRFLPFATRALHVLLGHAQVLIDTQDRLAEKAPEKLQFDRSITLLNIGLLYAAMGTVQGDFDALLTTDVFPTLQVFLDPEISRYRTDTAASALALIVETMSDHHRTRYAHEIRSLLETALTARLSIDVAAAATRLCHSCPSLRPMAQSGIIRLVSEVLIGPTILPASTTQGERSADFDLTRAISESILHEHHDAAANYSKWTCFRILQTIHPMRWPGAAAFFLKYCSPYLHHPDASVRRECIQCCVPLLLLDCMDGDNGADDGSCTADSNNERLDAMVGIVYTPAMCDVEVHYHRHIDHLEHSADHRFLGDGSVSSQTGGLATRRLKRNSREAAPIGTHSHGLHVGRTHMAIMRKVIRMMTQISVSDPLQANRLAALKSLVAEVDQFIAPHDEHIDCLFEVLNDEVLENRLEGLRIVSRIAHANPSVIFPRLRAMFLRFLADAVANFNLFEVEERLAFLFELIRSVPQFASLYLQNLLEMLTHVMIRMDVSPATTMIALRMLEFLMEDVADEEDWHHFFRLYPIVLHHVLDCQDESKTQCALGALQTIVKCMTSVSSRGITDQQLQDTVPRLHSLLLQRPTNFSPATSISIMKLLGTLTAIEPQQPEPFVQPSAGIGIHVGARKRDALFGIQDAAIVTEGIQSWPFEVLHYLLQLLSGSIIPLGEEDLSLTISVILTIFHTTPSVTEHFHSFLGPLFRILERLLAASRSLPLTKTVLGAVAQLLSTSVPRSAYVHVNTIIHLVRQHWDLEQPSVLTRMCDVLIVLNHHTTEPVQEYVAWFISALLGALVRYADVARQSELVVKVIVAIESFRGASTSTTMLIIIPTLCQVLQTPGVLDAAKLHVARVLVRFIFACDVEPFLTRVVESCMTQLKCSRSLFESSLSEVDHMKQLLAKTRDAKKRSVLEASLKAVHEGVDEIAYLYLPNSSLAKIVVTSTISGEVKLFPLPDGPSYASLPLTSAAGGGNTNARNTTNAQTGKGQVNNTFSSSSGGQTWRYPWEQEVVACLCAAAGRCSSFESYHVAVADEIARRFGPRSDILRFFNSCSNPNARVSLKGFYNATTSNGMYPTGHSFLVSPVKSGETPVLPHGAPPPPPLTFTPLPTRSPSRNEGQTMSGSNIFLSPYGGQIQPPSQQQPPQQDPTTVTTPLGSSTPDVRSPLTSGPLTAQMQRYRNDSVHQGILSSGMSFAGSGVKYLGAQQQQSTPNVSIIPSPERRVGAAVSQPIAVFRHHSSLESVETPVATPHRGDAMHHLSSLSKTQTAQNSLLTPLKGQRRSPIRDVSEAIGGGGTPLSPTRGPLQAPSDIQSFFEQHAKGKMMDWKAWFEQLCTMLIQQSRHLYISACAVLARRHYVIACEFFRLGFLSHLTSCNQQEREDWLTLIEAFERRHRDNTQVPHEIINEMAKLGHAVRSTAAFVFEDADAPARLLPNDTVVRLAQKALNMPIAILYMERQIVVQERWELMPYLKELYEHAGLNEESQSSSRFQKGLMAYVKRTRIDNVRPALMETMHLTDKALQKYRYGAGRSGRVPSSTQMFSNVLFSPLAQPAPPFAAVRIPSNGMMTPGSTATPPLPPSAFSSSPPPAAPFLFSDMAAVADSMKCYNHVYDFGSVLDLYHVLGSPLGARLLLRTPAAPQQANVIERRRRSFQVSGEVARQVALAAHCLGRWEVVLDVCGRSRGGFASFSSDSPTQPELPCPPMSRELMLFAAAAECARCNFDSSEEILQRLRDMLCDASSVFHTDSTKRKMDLNMLFQNMSDMEEAMRSLQLTTAKEKAAAGQLAGGGGAAQGVTVGGVSIGSPSQGGIDGMDTTSLTESRLAYIGARPFPTQSTLTHRALSIFFRATIIPLSRQVRNVLTLCEQYRTEGFYRKPIETLSQVLQQSQRDQQGVVGSEHGCGAPWGCGDHGSAAMSTSVPLQEHEYVCLRLEQFRYLLDSAGHNHAELSKLQSDIQMEMDSIGDRVAALVTSQYSSGKGGSDVDGLSPLAHRSGGGGVPKVDSEGMISAMTTTTYFSHPSSPTSPSGGGGMPLLRSTATSTNGNSLGSASVNVLQQLEELRADLMILRMEAKKRQMRYFALPYVRRGNRDAPSPLFETLLIDSHRHNHHSSGERSKQYGSFTGGSPFHQPTKGVAGTAMSPGASQHRRNLHAKHNNSNNLSTGMNPFSSCSDNNSFASGGVGESATEKTFETFLTFFQEAEAAVSIALAVPQLSFAGSWKEFSLLYFDLCKVMRSEWIETQDMAMCDNYRTRAKEGLFALQKAVHVWAKASDTITSTAGGKSGVGGSHHYSSVASAVAITRSGLSVGAWTYTSKRRVLSSRYNMTTADLLLKTINLAWNINNFEDVNFSPDSISHWALIAPFLVHFASRNKDMHDGLQAMCQQSLSLLSQCSYNLISTFEQLEGTAPLLSPHGSFAASSPQQQQGGSRKGSTVVPTSSSLSAATSAAAHQKLLNLLGAQVPMDEWWASQHTPEGHSLPMTAIDISAVVLPRSVRHCTTTAVEKGDKKQFLSFDVAGGKQADIMHHASSFVLCDGDKDTPLVAMEPTDDDATGPLMRPRCQSEFDMGDHSINSPDAAGLAERSTMRFSSTNLDEFAPAMARAASKDPPHAPGQIIGLSPSLQAERGVGPPLTRGSSFQRGRTSAISPSQPPRGSAPQASPSNAPPALSYPPPLHLNVPTARHSQIIIDIAKSSPQHRSVLHAALQFARWIVTPEESTICFDSVSKDSASPSKRMGGGSRSTGAVWLEGLRGCPLPLPSWHIRSHFSKSLSTRVTILQAKKSSVSVSAAPFARETVIWLQLSDGTRLKFHCGEADVSVTGGTSSTGGGVSPLKPATDVTASSPPAHKKGHLSALQAAEVTPRKLCCCHDHLQSFLTESQSARLEVSHRASAAGEASRRSTLTPLTSLQDGQHGPYTPRVSTSEPASPLSHQPETTCLYDVLPVTTMECCVANVIEQLPLQHARRSLVIPITAKQFIVQLITPPLGEHNGTNKKNGSMGKLADMGSKEFDSLEGCPKYVALRHVTVPSLFHLMDAYETHRNGEKGGRTGSDATNLAELGIGNHRQGGSKSHRNARHPSTFQSKQKRLRTSMSEVFDAGCASSEALFDAFPMIFGDGAAVEDETPLDSKKPSQKQSRSRRQRTRRSASSSGVESIHSRPPLPPLIAKRRSVDNAALNRRDCFSDGDDNDFNTSSADTSGDDFSDTCETFGQPRPKALQDAQKAMSAHRCRILRQVRPKYEGHLAQMMLIEAADPSGWLETRAMYAKQLAEWSMVHYLFDIACRCPGFLVVDVGTGHLSQLQMGMHALPPTLADYRKSARVKGSLDSTEPLDGVHGPANPNSIATRDACVFRMTHTMRKALPLESPYGGFLSHAGECMQQILRLRREIIGVAEYGLEGVRMNFESRVVSTPGGGLHTAPSSSMLKDQQPVSSSLRRCSADGGGDGGSNHPFLRFDPVDRGLSPMPREDASSSNLFLQPFDIEEPSSGGIAHDDDALPSEAPDMEPDAASNTLPCFNTGKLMVRLNEVLESDSRCHTSFASFWETYSGSRAPLMPQTSDTSVIKPHETKAHGGCSAPSSLPHNPSAPPAEYRMKVTKPSFDSIDDLISGLRRSAAVRIQKWLRQALAQRRKLLAAEQLPSSVVEKPSMLTMLAYSGNNETTHDGNGGSPSLLSEMSNASRAAADAFGGSRCGRGTPPITFAANLAHPSLHDKDAGGKSAEPLSQSAKQTPEQPPPPQVAERPTLPKRCSGIVGVCFKPVATINERVASLIDAATCDDNIVGRDWEAAPHPWISWAPHW